MTNCFRILYEMVIVVDVLHFYYELELSNGDRKYHVKSNLKMNYFTFEIAYEKQNKAKWISLLIKLMRIL